MAVSRLSVSFPPPSPVLNGRSAAFDPAELFESRESRRTDMYVLQTGPTLAERIDTVVNQIVEGAIDFGLKALIFVLAAAIVYFLGKAVLLPVVRRVLDARDVDPTIAKPAQKLALAVVAFVVVAVAFAVAGFGNILSSLATIAAALTLAIGFASQDVISNLVAGVFMISDPKLKIGDWVEWNGNAGVIEDISFRVTRVRTFNNELITVPNSELTTTAITNPVAKDTLRIPFTFGVGYDDDLEHAKAVIVEEARENDEILDEPAPSVRVTELADSYVGIQSRFWIEDPARADFVRIKSDYVQAVKERCDAEAIEMPYPYRELAGGIEVKGLSQTAEAKADD
jgi:small-conductance mechanosensitive channel